MYLLQLPKHFRTAVSMIYYYLKAMGLSCLLFAVLVAILEAIVSKKVKYKKALPLLCLTTAVLARKKQDQTGRMTTTLQHT